jgi:hypothetical protein
MQQQQQQQQQRQRLSAQAHRLVMAQSLGVDHSLAGGQMF